MENLFKEIKAEVYVKLGVKRNEKSQYLRGKSYRTKCTNFGLSSQLISSALIQLWSSVYNFLVRVYVTLYFRHYLLSPVFVYSF